MNKIEVYQVHTKKGLIFALEVYEDAQSSHYLAKIAPIVPLNQVRPGESPDCSGYPVAEPDYSDQNKDTLIEHCKERITEMGGEITVCRKAILRTERGLSIAGTRITIYQLMDYLKADQPASVIKDLFRLSDEEMDGVLEYILEYLKQYPHKDEEEYQEVLRQAEASRTYWETRNRERLQAIARRPPKPGTEEIHAQIEKKKAELGIR
jgi:uncharacterized protein (DUF433 family)